jgi:RNase P subunit RPR2
LRFARHVALRAVICGFAALLVIGKEDRIRLRGAYGVTCQSCGKLPNDVPTCHAAGRRRREAQMTNDGGVVAQ